MKLGTKLITGFLIVALSIAFVGFFGLISNNIIQENNKLGLEIRDLVELLDESLIKLLQLVETENTDDYYLHKSYVENIRKDFDALSKKLHEESEKKLQTLGFNIEVFSKDGDNSAKISNKLIATHKRKLATIKEFEEKKELGRSEQELGKIIAEQKTIEAQERLAIRELQKLIKLLEENEERIVNKIRAESKVLTRNTQLIMFAVIVGMFLVSIILGLTIARSITEPIRKLMGAMVEIGKGKLDTRIEITSRDEIGDLATNFSRMTDDLSKSRDEVVSAKDYTDNIIKSMIDTLIVVDPDARIKTINKATFDLLGYKEEDLIGKPVATIFAEEETPFMGTRMKKLIEEGSIRDYDMTFKTKTGVKIPISFSGSVMRDKEGELVGIVGIARDMREIKLLIQKEKELAVAASAVDVEKKKNEELQKAYEKLKTTQVQLFQTSKLATLGEMSAGLAHEINQPLGGISLVAKNIRKLIEREELSMEELQSCLKDIETSVKRMSKTIRHIRIFARQDTLKFVEVDVNETIDSALSLLGEQLRLHSIEVVLDFSPALPKIDGEPNQLEQVWINIISNARDAIVTKKAELKDKHEREFKGRIAISVDLCRFKSREFVEICIQDNGIGMSEEEKGKIFDPFFTTKEVGKATGLGLSISYGILESHKGKIKVESKDGGGTTMRILLPV